VPTAVDTVEEKRLLIAGYTDSVGSDEANVILSQLRGFALKRCTESWLCDHGGSQFLGACR